MHDQTNKTNHSTTRRNLIWKMLWAKRSLDSFIALPLEWYGKGGGKQFFVEQKLQCRRTAHTWSEHSGRREKLDQQALVVDHGLDCFVYTILPKETCLEEISKIVNNISKLYCCITNTK
jgi:hypothetical protein